MNVKILLAGCCLLIGCSLYSQGFSVYLQKGHEKKITELQFDQSGSHLLSKDSGGTYLLWDFFAHQEINRYTYRPTLSYWITAYHRDSSISLKIGKKNNKIICKRDNKTFFVIPSVLYDFDEVVVNSDESYMAYRTKYDEKIFVRNFHNMGALQIIDLPEIPTSLAFHPIFPHLLLAGMANGNIIAYDILQRKPIFNLISALFTTEDINVASSFGKTFISSGNSYFVKDNDYFDNLEFSQFNWQKKAYSYTSALKDSSSVFSYFWNNYSIYQSHSDSVEKIRIFFVQRFNNRFWAPLTIFSVMASNLQSLYFLFRLAPYLKWSKNYEPGIKLTSHYIWLNKNQSVSGLDLINKQTHSCFSHGEGPITYTVNDRYLVTWRSPCYLTSYNLQKNWEKQVTYAPEVNSISLIEESDTLVLQYKDKFRLIRMMDGWKGKIIVDGRFVNYCNGQMFYELEHKLFCLNAKNFQPIKLPQNWQLMKVVSFERNHQQFYNLYFNFGTIMQVDGMGTIIGYVYLYKGGDYLLVLPDNYFYASSKKMLQNITINDSIGSSYSLGQMEVKYNRPDLVMERLGCADTNRLKLIKIAHLKNIDRNEAINQDLSQAKFPAARIDNWNQTYYTKDSFFLCHLHYESKDSVLKNVNLTVNSNPIWGIQGMDLSARQITTFDTIVRVLLASGDNYIRPVCKTNSLLKNKTVTYFIKADYKASPVLHFLGIGVDEYKTSGRSLTFAASDVARLGKLLKDNYGGKCLIDSLKNKEVTRDAVIAKLNQLQHCGVNDLVIISYSGHGLLNEKLDLFLGTYAVNFRNPSENGLPYDELEQALEKIPAHRKIMFIDACNSGNIDKKVYIKKLEDSIIANQSVLPSDIVNNNNLVKSEDDAYYLMNNVYSNVLEENGAIVMTAARGNQFAKEGTKWGSGIFAYCLLEAIILKKADTDKDGHVLISELKAYLNKEVYKQSNGHQVPVFRRDNDEFDWHIQ